MRPIRKLSLSRKVTIEETLSIEVNDNIQCMVGKDSQHFITKTGCVVRKLAKFDVAIWSKLGLEHRLDLYNTVTNDFEFHKSECSKAATHNDKVLSSRKPVFVVMPEDVSDCKGQQKPIVDKELEN
ncbi:hypothetical protein ACH5RR_032619 [Cinchona calisaya]|uniref:Uncharacterized protein n=1 Tax=Cinchona calisaya TaxID=153742 RepID=A0ABD2YIL0_9GENT